MQAPDQIADLIFKYLRNELSDEEEKLLTSWRLESPKNEEIFFRLTDARQVQELLQGFHSRKKSWDKILEMAPELKHSSDVAVPRIRRFPVAATIILVLGITMLIALLIRNRFVSNESTSIVKEKITDSAVVELPPGKTRATLTLSNGDRISLDSGKAVAVAGKSEDHILQLDSGQIQYANSNSAGVKKEIYNTLETPRGGQFILVLPDGSKAWLNAASYIKYPVAFSGKQRLVDIRGEIYFEVAKNAKMPFVIQTRKTEVEVLGTHFNVNAYEDEPAIAVTLLEGSVRAGTATSNTILKPGEEALISSGKIQLLKGVDVSRVVSWKNGRILFKDADLPTIMRMISRWYDIDVVYAGEVPERNLTGGISRNANLSEILKVLEWNKIHFSVVNKTITITP